MDIERVTGDMPSAEVWRSPVTRINGFLVRFPNGYGASIINHAGSYGVELAVIHFKSAERDSWDFAYDTPVTDDVMGWLDPDSLTTALRDIAQLPIRRTAIDA